MRICARDVIVVPLSTVLRPGPWHVPLRRGQGGVPLPSVLKCEQVTTVGVDRLEPRALGAALSPSVMTAVERAILRAIGVPA